jgi:hypothetical protein
MNNKSKSAGCPAPDENRIEEILSNIQPVPGNGFHQKMQGSPWQAARRQQGKSTMKTKFAFSVLTMLLVLAATVAFVPPVQAQVAEWFTVIFHDPDGSGSSFGVGGDQPMKYQVLQPGYLPKGLSDRTIAKFGDITEVLYKTDDEFLILTEMAAVEGESLPEGEAVTVNGQPAVLNMGLSGSYQELPEGVQPSDGGSIVIPDETDANESMQAPIIEPLTFDYTDAVIDFMTGNKN